MCVVANFNIPSSSCGIVSQVTSETRDSWDKNNDSELSTFLSSPDDGVSNGSANLVEDGRLLVASCSDCS